jgi:hypothetical protein
MQFWGTAVEWCFQTLVDDLPKGRVLHRVVGCGASGKSASSGDAARLREGVTDYKHVVFMTFGIAAKALLVLRLAIGIRTFHPELHVVIPH